MFLVLICAHSVVFWLGYFKLLEKKKREKKAIFTPPESHFKYTKEILENTKEIFIFLFSIFQHENDFLSYFKARGCIAEVLTVL